MTKNVEIIERNAQRLYGCTHGQALELNAGQPLRLHGSLVSRYLFQRQAAKKRGIGWEITLPEWAAIWAESGKWSLRGVGIGCYCMSRHGDVGPYKVGNVSIKTSVENSREGIERGRPAMLRNNRHILNKLGTGRGWSLLSSRHNPYQVYLGKKYIGRFASQQEAEAAYRRAVASVHESLSVR